jgi:UPF0716 protein FxsA
MLLVLILLIAWPVAEVLLAIQVAHAIGVLTTVVLLVLTWPLGSWALRSQGQAAWRRLMDAVAQGRTPTREALDGVLVLIGGVFLIIPGFITDVIGACLLLAPTRAAARGLLTRNLQSRVVVRASRFGSRPYDVDSTAHDVDQPRLRP